MNLTTVIGLFAAFCTTAANYPQLKKCWATQRAGDLSFKMFVLLATGVTAWVVYGILQADYVIIGANIASLALILGVLYFIVRERFFQNNRTQRAKGRGSQASNV